MSVRTFTRAVATPPVVEVRNPAGSVTVAAVEGSTGLSVRVEALDEAAEELLDRVVVEASEEQPVRLRVVVPEHRLFRTPSFAVRVDTPAGAAVLATVASARCELRGALGRVVLTSASGDCSVESCAEAQVRSASGDVALGAVAGPATVHAASGDVRLGSAAGAVEVRTASGDVEVGAAGGDLSLRTTSGDVEVGSLAAGSTRVTSVSGDVTLGVRPGLRVWLDLASVSGRLESELADEAAGKGAAELTVAARSVSGDVRIRRTAPVG
ncbi:hypothetical protein DQ238_08880 [Geodermatophilus sp. TF02-6]|uniref:DUF4097 family beta strand repeat-containing protein n=1 Tax=Geodermatophilus sp. TF02-6 TaxID=2250575 RepID=UPI000DEB3EEB|nr:DUF4097 family beta strand repeat-containing protein [Geodermatophilus sp. TF02-6]RBY80664.1 hypothetical protein DQ238_08880 [Geodermatophilus sp. TF02-6]